MDVNYYYQFKNKKLQETHEKSKVRESVYYIVLALFDISAMVCFISGNASGNTFIENMGFVWSACRITFPCLGSVNKKK